MPPALSTCWKCCASGAAAAGLIFTSTNKVYGAIDDIDLVDATPRYDAAGELAAHRHRRNTAAQFHSPYGCSKGTADQYVLDYARSYGLATAVLPHELHLRAASARHRGSGLGRAFHDPARAGTPITIYGDGKQVRDLLFVDDLIDALLLAEQHLPEIAGQAFNIGGGPDNTLSLLELIDAIAALNGAPPKLEFGAWRVGDQRWYVSDHAKFTGRPAGGRRSASRRACAAACMATASAGASAAALQAAAQ